MDKNAGISANRVLIFPGGMPRSLEFLQRCLMEGQSVIGASSLAYDVAREKYPAWGYLPFITDPGFEDALRVLVQEAGIGGIYTPNPVIWNRLNANLKAWGIEAELVNASPVETELGGYRDAMRQACSWLDKPLWEEGQSPMSEIELAAMIRHVSVIPGQSDLEKICGLSEIARIAPPGDVVEIGSLWGKSAFVLAHLARRYGLGKLLCVDPWTSENLVQKDETGMVDQVSAQWDTNEAFLVFQMNLLPYSAGHINFLRMPSVEAAARYRTQKRVESASFGATDYRGEIAMLHIDGNHAYPAVKADVAEWSGLMAPGGWIVVDDYIWPYGDGPQRVGDAFLESNRERITCAFVMGGALFIQLAD